MRAVSVSRKVRSTTCTCPMYVSPREILDKPLVWPIYTRGMLHFALLLESFYVAHRPNFLRPKVRGRKIQGAVCVTVFPFF